MAFPSTQPSAASQWTPLINAESTDLPICTPVYSSGSGSFGKAVGDGSSKAQAIGLVIDPSIASGKSGNILTVGAATASTAQWDAIAGTSGGLTGNVTYYLDATTPGRLTTSSASNVAVIKAVSTTTATIVAAGSNLANTGVTPGAYTAANVTVGSDGRIASATNGISGSELAAAGLVAGGVVDNSAALLASIASAQAAARRLYLPAGTYKLSSAVAIAAGTTRIRGDGTIFTFDSTARNAFTLPAGTATFQIEGVTFQGNASNDYAVNYFPAFEMLDGCTDVDIGRCRFENCLPVQADDSYNSRRLKFWKNYVHNAPNGLHPCSDTSIDDCDFINDTIVSTRAQMIYAYGQQTNISITNCRFKNGSHENIQIRSTSARFAQRNQFRISGCHFENASQYAIWVGSDDHPEIGDAIITGNTFRNCVGPINCYARSAVISSNHIEYDWEYPFTIPGTASCINLATAIGGIGRYNVGHGVRVSNNKFIIKHPFVAKITIDAGNVGLLPSNNDTVTVGAITYTWKTTPASAFDIQIGADRRACTQSLRDCLGGVDGLATAPNNVLRYETDVFNNFYGASYGETNDNIVVISSWYDHTSTFARTGTALTLTNPVDYRASAGYAIQVVAGVAPVIESNTIDDFSNGIGLQQCQAPTIRNNTFNDNTGTWSVIQAYGNVFSHYSGNRWIQLNPMAQGRQYYPQITDGFAVIEDPWVLPPQFTTPQLFGRQGIVPVGDGKATAYFYYGSEVATDSYAASRSMRWDDSDTFYVYDGTTNWNCQFRRTSPSGASRQFNTADTLLAVINAIGTVTAAYVPFQNDLGGVNQKMMMQLKAASAGTAGNSMFVNLRRFRIPNDAATYSTVPQPLITGQMLRNSLVPEEFCRFFGGAATAIKTFVPTPLASTSRGVQVSGVDATSQALAPVVYLADIIPGVGFTITHTVAAGTEKFFWRVS